jgi:putative ABC transport system permease protein
MSFSRLVRRAVYWLQFRKRQDELQEELLLHRELLADELSRRGLSPDQAQDEARRTMGNETLIREHARAVWFHAGLDSLLSDWGSAIRTLRRSPAFVALVTLIVALTIAANTLVFSVVRQALLDPLPFTDGNRIAEIGLEAAADPLAIQFGITSSLFQGVAARGHTLDELSGVTRAPHRVDGQTDQPALPGVAVTPSFLPMLRVRAILGRAFTENDARAGAAPVMMVREDLWRSRYGSDPEIIGRMVDVDGTRRTIIGVLPSIVDIPMSREDAPLLWLPLEVTSSTDGLMAFGRLRAGASSTDATYEVRDIARAMSDTIAGKGLRWRVASVQDRVEPHDRRALEVLFVAVAGLLLIGCANIATLLLMRGSARHREVAIRLALGAGRARVIRQLLLESLLMALLGGAGGLLLARGGLSALVAIYPGGLNLGVLDGLDTVHIDAAIMAWSSGLTILAGLVFGIGPALFSSTTSLDDALRAGAPTAADNIGARRLRSAFVVTQIALSLVFLSAAALLTRSFIALVRTPLGLDPHGLVTVQLNLAPNDSIADRGAFEQALLQAVRAVPGVTDASFGGGLAHTDIGMGPFIVDGPIGTQTLDLALCEMPFVGPEYFRVTRVPIIEGRTFDATDRTAAAREVVINRALAQRIRPDGHVVGMRLRSTAPRAVTKTIVGVAGDLNLPGVHGDMFGVQIYRAASASRQPVTTLSFRTNAPNRLLEPTLRTALEGAGTPARFARMWLTESVVMQRFFARPRFALVIFVVFALMSLALCAVGLYGILAYAVAQRTREIGIRVALGAEQRAIAGLLLGYTARVVAIGGLLGFAGAYLGGRLLGSLLYQVRSTDPVALGGAVAVLVTVALTATWAAFRRALAIHPVDALRMD